jgi:hypothetical protein
MLGVVFFLLGNLSQASAYNSYRGRSRGKKEQGSMVMPCQFFFGPEFAFAWA